MLSKSDKLWRHYKNVLDACNNYPPLSNEYNRLVKYGWKIMEKYIEQLFKEFKIRR